MSKKDLLYFFAGGFLFVFGLSDNPLYSLRYKFKEENDMKNIESDWINVGKGIQKSYVEIQKSK